jgi:hypothetical protein
MRIVSIVTGLLLAVSTYGQSIVTPMFVYKDGEASASGYAGSEKDILIDGGVQRVVGWVTFLTEGVDVSSVVSAKLALYVHSLVTPGTLDVYALMAPVNVPENSVSLSVLKLSPAKLASIMIGANDAEKIVLLEIGAAVKSGAFYGVALKSDDGLDASFDSKEGNSAPLILLSHILENVAAKWLSGATAPTAGLGRDGDYYLNTITGDVSAKTDGKWGLLTNLQGKAGAPGVAVSNETRSEKGIQGAPGLPGPKGADGLTTSVNGISQVDGKISLTTANIPASPDKNYMTDSEKAKLAGIAAGAEVNVQADWVQANSSADDFIRNKPTSPAGANDSETKAAAGKGPDIINAIPSMTKAERDALKPVAGMVVYNRTANKPNYYNGKTWMTFNETLAFSIGENFGGGVLAYTLQSGDPGFIPGEVHGLIAAPADQSISAEWGCDGTTLAGTSANLGTGAANTAAIVKGCTTAGIAAKKCADLELNGYSDWYLPSKDELNKLYMNKEAIGGLSSAFYWSSSGETYNMAWVQNFADGNQYTNRKNYPNGVRAVRAF